MNTPVNFELAKLLKEKGFDVKVRGRIHVSYWHLVKDNIIPSNVNIYYTDMFAPLGNWNDGIQHFMSIPTIAEVVMWLYEKHELWIIVGFSCDETCYSMVTNKICDVRWNNKGFKSPTEAYEASIDYTLNNLI